MTDALIYCFLAGLVAFLISSATIPLVRRIALSVRAVDYPGGRHEQAEAIPRLGGVSPVLGFIIGSSVVAALNWGTWSTEITSAQLISIPLALCIIILCGFVEDTIGLSPLTRILMQATAALLMVKAGWCFDSINVPFIGNLQLGILGGILSMLWIVGVTNAINFLDGLDGLASGVVAIICSSMLVLALWRKDFLTALVMGAAVGASLGFLRKNWAPAKIYLGDSGSLTFGFILALVSIRSSIKASAAIAILVPILALGLPVIDTLLVMLYRFMQGKKRRSRKSFKSRFARMFHPDHSHLHYLMLRLGPSRRRIVIIIYSIAAAFCAMALIVASSSNLNLGMLLVVIEVFVVLGIRQLGLKADARKMSLEKREAVRKMIISKGNSKQNVTPIKRAG
jgi:UDP-GlcNAc:undecaprenyl-phosphate GlcNAc-1-phosphate transferase